MSPNGPKYVGLGCTHCLFLYVAKFIHNSFYSRQHLEDRWNTCDSEYMVQQSKIKKLSKQLEKNREKIDNLECRFEDEFGDRPSDVDKQNSKTFRKLLLQQSRLKRQIRHCRESGDSGIWEDYSPPVTSPNRYSTWWSTLKCCF